MAGKGQPKTGGRKKGTPNKTTALLKDAIIKAAEAHGADGTGEDDLEGYCFFLANQHPTSFATLLGKVLPMQIEGTGPNGAIPISGLNIAFGKNEPTDG